MRPLIFGILVFLAILAAGVLYTANPGSEAAYEAAEKRIAAAAEDDLRVLRLSDLGGLGKLPPELGELTNLTQLDLRGTAISDVSALASLENLRILSLRRTLVDDLQPLEGLSALDTLDLSQTWVRDLSPLTTLPALRRLDIGGTWTSSLAPLRDVAKLDWINLHSAITSDGSQDHFRALKDKAVTVNNGRAIADGHRPGLTEKMRLRVNRLSRRIRLGFQHRSG
jgi:hypothetical protein